MKGKIKHVNLYFFGTSYTLYDLKAKRSVFDVKANFRTVSMALFQVQIHSFSFLQYNPVMFTTCCEVALVSNFKSSRRPPPKGPLFQTIRSVISKWARTRSEQVRQASWNKLFNPMISGAICCFTFRLTSLIILN